MNFIALFKFKRTDDEVVKFFNDHLEKEIESDFTYSVTHGRYTSDENRNHGYNYLLKINGQDNQEIFQFRTDKKYKSLLQKLDVLLLDKQPKFFYYVEEKKYNRDSQENSTVKHIVLLNFKEECTKKEIEKSFSELLTLFNSLTIINSFSYGSVLSSKTTYIFEMEFSDVSARNQYLDDDQHKAVAHSIIPFLQGGETLIIAFDYLLPIKNEDKFFLCRDKTNVDLIR